MAHFYRIENASGASVTLCDYGASIVSLLVPDRQKLLRDVVLGYAHVKGYETGGEYFGETVGRCCNRICHGRFVLNGQQIQLNCNDGKHHLHGGYRSLSRRIWQAECGGNSVAFTTESPDGEEHYSGNLQVTVTYTFDDTNTLTIAYDAVCDKDTICNLTNHSYFNMAGHERSELCMDQELTMAARHFLPDDAASIPTGELRSVVGTPMDFRTPKPIGRDLNEEYDALLLQHGYDHNFEVFCNPAAILKDPHSGRTMAVTTDCPGIQLYSGNFLDVMGKNGVHYPKHGGVALETQYYPDSVNHPEWKQPIFQAGQPYHSVTAYHFYN